MSKAKSEEWTNITGLWRQGSIVIRDLSKGRSVENRSGAYQSFEDPYINCLRE